MIIIAKITINKLIEIINGAKVNLNDTSTLMLERANKIIVNNLEKIIPVPIPIINDNKATKLISITYILPILPLSSPINVKIQISFFRCAKKTFVAYQIKKKTKITNTIEITSIIVVI